MKCDKCPERPKGHLGEERSELAKKSLVWPGKARTYLCQVHFNQAIDLARALAIPLDSLRATDAPAAS